MGAALTQPEGWALTWAAARCHSPLLDASVSQLGGSLKRRGPKAADAAADDSAVADATVCVACVVPPGGGGRMGGPLVGRPGGVYEWGEGLPLSSKPFTDPRNQSNPPP